MCKELEKEIKEIYSEVNTCRKKVGDTAEIKEN